MASQSEMPILSWKKDNTYLISTDPSLIPLDALNNRIFGAEDFDWGKPLPTAQLKTLVERSLCFGLYELQSPPLSAASPSVPPSELHYPYPRLIGFARLITDLVTVHYLTDVYILPQYRSLGLGVWMMQCVNEVFKSNPHLRGMILIADRGSRTEEFYRRHLHMGDLKGVAFCMDRKGRGA
ncbi:hypothetical protein H2200_000345 [Cladophialophora chaetospira]|uniref:N-acetyltransferase domain-containing protein n=1 Tax=Cladophialophora chaetospira TaxID=386627 RepID=A0AA38XP39_9EURO|nr:hypothetical protein H2200_000345 [Cladophialophora chaetospira]